MPNQPYSSAHPLPHPTLSPLPHSPTPHAPTLGPSPEPHCPPASPPIAHSPQYLLYLAEIGENTAALVHDMRSPLTVIINGLRLCQRMPLPQIAGQRLTLALEEAERLNRMVNDVIAFARSGHSAKAQWLRPEQRVYPTRYGVESTLVTSCGDRPE